MDHEALQSLIPAYAIGATDKAESRLVADHLPSCSACQALLAEYQTLGDDLLFTVSVMSAPAGLGARLRARVTPVPRQGVAGRWASWVRGVGSARAWTAVAAFAILALVATNVYWSSRVGRLEGEAARQTAALDSLTRGPEVAWLSATPGMSGRGVVYASAAGDVALLCVYGMRALPSDSNYQLWLIKDGLRESGGVFAVGPKGYGVLLLRPSRPLGDYDSLGITVEPVGGSPGPTTPRVLGAEEL